MKWNQINKSGYIYSVPNRYYNYKTSQPKGHFLIPILSSLTKDWINWLIFF